MGEIGAAGDVITFPSTADTNDVAETISTTVRAKWAEDVANAIVAIEGALGEGINYSTTLKNYLDTQHNIDGTHDSTIVGMLAGTQTFSGAKTFSSTLDVDGALTANGAITASSTIDVTGTTTLNGDVNLGNAIGDSITVNGTLKNWPAFTARRVTTNQSINTAYEQVIFNQEQTDTDNMYEVTTGLWSPTVAGYYILTTSIKIGTPSTDDLYEVHIYKNSTSMAVQSLNPADGETFGWLSVSLVAYNDGNDTFSVRCNFGDTKNVTASEESSFAGCRLR